MQSPAGVRLVATLGDHNIRGQVTLVHYVGVNSQGIRVYEIS